MTWPGSRRTWLIPLFVNTALVQVITFVLRPTTSYRALELDVPTHWLGALGASFALIPLLIAVPSGHAADRFGERHVMIVGSIVTVLAAASLFLVGGSVGGLLAGSVLLGVGHLCSVVGQQAMVANRTASDRYDAGFGHYTFVASAGQALGPALIVLFGGTAVIPDTSRIFAWAMVLGVPLVVSAILLPAPSRRESQRRDQTTEGLGTLLSRPGLLRALTVSQPLAPTEESRRARSGPSSRSAPAPRWLPVSSSVDLLPGSGAGDFSPEASQRAQPGWRCFPCPCRSSCSLRSSSSPAWASGQGSR
jgi:MFS family permease